MDSATPPAAAGVSNIEVKPGVIFGKMIEVLREIEPIGKGRQNTQQGFAYRGVDDVYNALQPIFAKVGIVLLPVCLSTESSDRPVGRDRNIWLHSKVMVKFYFYAEDGSYIAATVPGEASDQGDKSIGKACQYAIKLLLLQTFLIPTADESKDPDANSVQGGWSGRGRPAWESDRGGREPPPRRDDRRSNRPGGEAPPPAGPRRSSPPGEGQPVIDQKREQAKIDVGLVATAIRKLRTLDDVNEYLISDGYKERRKVIDTHPDLKKWLDDKISDVRRALEQGQELPKIPVTPSTPPRGDRGLAPGDDEPSSRQPPQRRQAQNHSSEPPQ